MMFWLWRWCLKFVVYKILIVVNLIIVVDGVVSIIILKLFVIVMNGYKLSWVYV